MLAPQFCPGVRLSQVDIVVLILGSVAAVVFWQQTWWIGFVIAFVIGHFFLFCNVFRLSRPLELTWAAIFVALTAGTILFEVPGWPATIALSLVTTATIVIVAMRGASYHGIGWQQINPKLPEWWDTQIANQKPASV